MNRARTAALAFLPLLSWSGPGTGAEPSYQPLLDGYVHEALANNPLMTAEMQALLGAELDLRAARATRLPSLDLEARYTGATGGRNIDFPVGQLFNPIHETLNFLLEQQGEPPAFPTNLQDISEPLLRRREQDTRLRLSAPLYAPAIGAGVAARAAQFALREAGLETTARTLVREVHRAFFSAAGAAASERILRASLELLSEDVRVAEVLVREGSATRDRHLRARAEELAAEQRLDAARARTRQARRRLAQLLDRDRYDDLGLPALTATGLPVDTQHAPRDSKTHRRPELEQLDQAVTAAEAQTRAAAAQRRPTLSLAADYGIEGRDYRFNSEAEIGTVSLLLRWNLFDFGRRGAERDAAAAAAAQLRAERADLARQLRLALDAAEDEAQVAERALITARARLEAAEAAFAIAERKRAEDALTQIEFLDAESALTEARLGVAIAWFEREDRHAELDFVRAGYPLPPLPIVAGPR